MSGSSPEDALARSFEARRGGLTAMAARILGSRADAEDAVQEAWLRLARQDPSTIDNLGGWLHTVVGRVCVDVLRSRRSRPESSYDAEPPELSVTEDPGGPPEEDALLAESVGTALLLVLDTLSPVERVVFVLHDMFLVPFDEVATIVGRSTGATKMMASRARRKVRGAQAPVEERRRQRTVVDAFLAATRDGDFDRLLVVLAPDAAWRTHTPDGVVVTLGATEVASAALRGAAHLATGTRRVLVNGRPGIAAWDGSGAPLGVLACTVIDDRIVEILSIRDPRRLATIDLPAPPP
ncbi:sigma-70 family RNA polymerase sigma factor [Spiractinospora alimapuensis]|uniref:sigma-70 family RNA polymerase sigma factor n=1 Tax=Spiractinospora alimapuensis TaxID=2820884 RepID=UPI001F18A76E|nr:sigma-70 family RNA polymerase sigma factor [Spiractinospora alimapuensis]QVQ52186.1 sigma-70 family RNA polymerase sigma factor [Spiractinospora alimapuensis]